MGKEVTTTAGAESVEVNKSGCLSLDPLKADIDDLLFERSAVESGKQCSGSLLVDLCTVEFDGRKGRERVGCTGLITNIGTRLFQ